MSTITHDCNIGSLTTRNAGSKISTGLRVLICAGLAVAITSLTAQAIGGAASVRRAASELGVSQLVQPYSAAPVRAPASLPAITVLAAR